MDNKELLKQLSRLGYPLFGQEDALDANMVLAEVAKSDNLRLWEGFPVVLAKAAEKNLFNPDLAKEYLRNPWHKTVFNALLHMSLALYQALGLKFPWVNEWCNSLSKQERKDVLSQVEDLKQNKDFKLANRQMSSQRLKSIFQNYFKETQSRLSDLLSRKEDASLEYALSQVFSPKQRELFLKKLKSEKLTKTESEYFSRVVKKKVLALANTELHQLAKRLLE